MSLRRYLCGVICGLSIMLSPQYTSAKSLGGEVWGKQYFPDVVLTRHTGEQQHFFDDLIEGKVVVINFIYTHCPDVCPLETSKLKEVYKLLADRVGDDVFFYSISIDPERDRPEVLAQYVQQFDIPETWGFYTGNEDDIRLLRQKLGLYYEPELDEKGKPKVLDHNISLVIGNQSTGRWMKRSPFENPYVLASQIGGELHNWKLPREVQRAYADAPSLRSISPAEQLYRTHCSACHTIGGGDAIVSSERNGNGFGGTQLGIGPDLLNVTQRRERRWLMRWIRQPDVMLAEQDPIAVSLFEQYRRIPMPNLSLTTHEVEILLSFIDKESRRLSAN